MIGHVMNSRSEDIWLLLHDLALFTAFARYPFAFHGYVVLRSVNNPKN